jgi:spermidine/putrescine transport system ATP-binding protein
MAAHAGNGNGRGDNGPVIVLEDVTKHYGGVLAVENARLEIGRGEFFSLLGPSGCGKTTTLRMIAGFEDVSSGCIRLDGVDVSRVPPYRRNVNTVFQQYALFPHLNVFDNVAFGPRIKGVAEPEVKRRVDAMLEIVHLSGFGTRRPDQLSGGQRQRVALARALVNVPSALLLDEPLSALDAQLRQSMQAELKRIQRELGITFVLVTHDQSEAMGLSDRIAVMRGGRVEQIGSPEAIYARPESAFVAGFVGDANLLRDEGALLMIRPEQVRLSSEAPDASEVGRRATVRDLTFRGPVIRCLLVDDAGEEIVADVRPDARPARLEPGSEMWATWSPAAAVLLRDDVGQR